VHSAIRVTTAPPGDLRQVALTQPRTVLRADGSTPIRGNQSLGAYGVLSCSAPKFHRGSASGLRRLLSSLPREVARTTGSGSLCVSPHPAGVPGDASAPRSSRPSPEPGPRPRRSCGPAPGAAAHAHRPTRRSRSASPPAAHLLVGGDHVQLLPLVLQWSPLRGDRWTGWHRHRHRAGAHAPRRHDEQEAGTSNWPPAGTTTWPPAGTFTWPRTSCMT